jgi:hypothetical protein
MIPARDYDHSMVRRRPSGLQFRYLQVPIFIVCRDKISALAQLVEWLEHHGYERLVLVDNASTYPPLLDYFQQSPHDVVRLADNLGPHDSIWSTGLRDRYAGGSYYVVTDSDVVPDSGCPGDAVGYFHWGLCRFPSFAKAGFGLRIDDLPEHYDLAASVRGWENRFWTRRFSGNLYSAPIDTTFALYRPDSAFELRPAIRTGKPYVARHQPWYLNSENLTEEERYYRAHCDPRVAHWDLNLNRDEIPEKGGQRSLKAKIKWRAHALWRIPRDRTIPRQYRRHRAAAAAG